MNLANHFHRERAGSSRCQRRAPARTPGNDARQAFTMMEIAISLAIIGIALVAIIGVLPIGMNAQQDNRQETIIGQDTSVLVEDIRNAALGANDLTNYIYYITNSWVEFNPVSGQIVQPGGNGYTYNSASSIPAGVYPGSATVEPLTNAANIIGLLSTPEFTDVNGNPTANIYTQTYFSNHVVAYVYSISGPAYEKPPQDNALMQQDSFGYRVFVVNTTQPLATNYFYPPFTGPTGPPIYNQRMLDNLHELRLTFLWPQSPNGNLGSGRQTFRTLVAGQLLHQPGGSYNSITYNQNEYYYQPQSFANTP